MAVEIEHKYLVDNRIWKNITPEKSAHIAQAYLCIEPKSTIRIRIKDTQAFITIKSKSVEDTRDEFEYEIPLKDAQHMMKTMCSDAIEKIRHYYTYEGKLWEVDEFLGDNEGLIIAEIELNKADEKYLVPEWAVRNVSSDRNYANSNLTKRPFKSW
jgi:adenylate cyclase